MKKILITGFSGFVARHFVEYLCERKEHYSVIGIDISDPKYCLDIYQPYVNIEFKKINMTKKEEVFSIFDEFKPDYVLHLAAYSSVAYSWKCPSESFMNNSNIFLNLIEVVKNLKLNCRILSVGSSEEYGKVSKMDIPLVESCRLNPINPYAVARVSQEMLSKIFVEAYGMDIVLTRSFNHIGPGQDTRFFVPSILKQVLDIKMTHLEKGTIEVGNIDIIRDFVDVRDVVRAYYMLLENGLRGEVYNICSANPVKLREIITVIAEMVDVEIEPIVNKNFIRPEDNEIICGSYAKIKKLGWEPHITLTQSIGDMISFCLLDENCKGN